MLGRRPNALARAASYHTYRGNVLNGNVRCYARCLLQRDIEHLRCREFRTEIETRIFALCVIGCEELAVRSL